MGRYVGGDQVQISFTPLQGQKITVPSTASWDFVFPPNDISLVPHLIWAMEKHYSVTISFDLSVLPHVLNWILVTTFYTQAELEAP